MKRILGEPRDTRKFSPISLAHESFELKMKKKTTITSEKYEVWRISQGDANEPSISEDVAIDVDPSDKPVIIPQNSEPETHTDQS